MLCLSMLYIYLLVFMLVGHIKYLLILNIVMFQSYFRNVFYTIRRIYFECAVFIRVTLTILTIRWLPISKHLILENKQFNITFFITNQSRSIIKYSKSNYNLLSNIPKVILKHYFNYISRARQRIDDKNWLKSIKQFRYTVYADPILRMNFEYGIYQCKETLSDETGDDVFEMIDTICKKSPSFSHSSLVGFPINFIFIQFMQNQDGRTFFSHESVNQALKKVLNEYGDMLLSPLSNQYLSEENQYGWFSPEANQVIHNQWYKCDPNLPNYGYKCWNDWFLRQFKEGMRPIGEGTPIGVHQQDVIINACQSAPLEKPKQPQFHVKLVDNFWLKDDHYSLSDMFGGKKHNKEELAKHFEGGTVYQAFLSALYYHRWHSPVNGVIEDIYAIDGTYYLDQSEFIPYDEGSPNNSQSFLTAVAARKVIVINTHNPKIGKIAIIFVGMAQVSSCVHTVQIGEKVKKGHQIGYFMFGGSSHAIIFEKKAKLHFKKDAFYDYNESTKEFESVRQNLHSYLAHVE